ncbi:2-phosphosulfolactate phosphatase [Sphingomonas sp. ac-8]|uniref:2-phosphosulfolactate phosphatase n=1 Tax=Sphingomonas sp. ac-8 TaxID=3242977 RepID=UPI003A808649
MIRSEWGLHGVERLRARVAVLVIVDVLSFSTSVDITTAQGAQVLPFPSGDRAAAQAAADAAGATLAAPRRAVGDRPSLSPRTLTALAAGTRLMLPSPNGSRLSVAAQGTPTLAGCLRNAGAVARAALALAGGGDIGVVPAGERWPDGTLRPAIEDLLGAGAILDRLDGAMDAEARVARDAYRGAGDDLPDIVRACVSGQELIGDGFEADVALALALDGSACAPRLVDGVYAAFAPA